MASRVPSPALVLLALIGVCPGAAALSAAPIYRWTDESGQTHITDDPNQVPASRRQIAPAPEPGIEPRPGARAAVDALRALTALVQDAPPQPDYAQGVVLAAQSVDPAVAAIQRGALRTALAAALACYREAAQLWENQIAVRRGVSLALNMAPIRRAWECGAQKTAEAERLLAARR